MVSMEAQAHTSKFYESQSFLPLGGLAAAALSRQR